MIDPTTIDALVLTAETDVFLNPATLADMGDTDDEFWSKLSDLVSESKPGSTVEPG
jgi:hypothetical protein